MSYILGFIQGDGHLQHKKLTIELNISDERILHLIGQELSSKYSITYRKRTTNFLKNHESCILTINSVELTKELNQLGIPYGRKSDIIAPPYNICSIDYIRGLIDADGAVGYTSQGFPFISLVTSSEEIKDFFLSFLESNLDIIKIVSRNKRDNIYNILIMRDNAVRLAKMLYYQGCISLDRKFNSAQEILNWINPFGKTKRIQYWTASEDQILLSNPINEEVSVILNRSVKSVKTRRWRLSKGQDISA
jgi:hypothetical protein